MSADDVDLNLLRVLDALLEEGSVVGAASKLHLSAPAVSRSLGRLRRATGDELFVRSGRNLVPTPHAIALQVQVRDALNTTTSLLTPAVPTDPSQFDRRFRISADDSIIVALGVPLLRRVKAHAPGVEIDFVNEPDDPAALHLGPIDLDLGVPHGPPNIVDHEVLFTDQFAATVRTGHPLTTTPVTLQSYSRAEHVGVVRREHRHRLGDDRVAADDTVPRIVATVPSFITAAHIVATTDLVALIPIAVVEALAPQLSIVALQVPFRLAARPVGQSWHKRHTNDPVHRWLRAQIAETTRQVRSVATVLPA